MRRCLSSLVLLLGLLAGCGPAQRPAARLVQRDILLGPTPLVNQLAESMALARSDWPSTYFGHVTEDRSETYEWFVDDQSYFDELDGGLYHESAAFRVRTLRR